VKTLTVTLPAEYADWLEARVAAGEYTTLDEAVLAAVNWLKSESDDDVPILPGSKLHTLLTEGVESLDRGEGVDGEEFMAELIARLSESATPVGAAG